MTSEVKPAGALSVATSAAAAAAAVTSPSAPPFLSAPTTYANRDNAANRAFINFARAFHRCQQLAYGNAPLAGAPASSTTTFTTAIPTPKPKTTTLLLSSPQLSSSQLDSKHSLHAHHKSSQSTSSSSSSSQLFSSKPATTPSNSKAWQQSSMVALSDEQRTKLLHQLHALSAQLDGLKGLPTGITSQQRSELDDKERELQFLTDVVERERAAIAAELPADPTIAALTKLAAAGAVAPSASSSLSPATGSSGGSAGEAAASRDVKSAAAVDSTADASAAAGGGGGESAGGRRPQAKTNAERQLSAASELRTRAYIRQKQRQLLFHGKTPAPSKATTAGGAVGSAGSSAANAGSASPAPLSTASEPELGADLHPPSVLHHHTRNPQEDLFSAPTPRHDDDPHGGEAKDGGLRGADGLTDDERALQDELAADMANQATILRQRARDISAQLKVDDGVLTDVDDKIDRNRSRLDKENARLRENTGGWCSEFAATLTVFAVCWVLFFATYLMMKVVPKPTA